MAVTVHHMISKLKMILESVASMLNQSVKSTIAKRRQLINQKKMKNFEALLTNAEIIKRQKKELSKIIAQLEKGFNKFYDKVEERLSNSEKMCLEISKGNVVVKQLERNLNLKSIMMRKFQT